MSKLISTRVSGEIEEDIGRLAREKHVGKTLILREVVIRGLADLKLDYALELYKKGMVSLWKAAGIAGISLWKMMDVVKERRIPAQYGMREAKEDIEQVFGE